MARHHGRELALKALFEHDLAHTPVDSVLARSEDQEPRPDWEFARDLVIGTLDHWPELNKAIETAAIDWKVNRMPVVDRNILRMAAYEIRYEASTPLSVIINEAVELAQSYSTDEAKRFVNGVLSTLAKTFRPEGDPDRH